LTSFPDLKTTVSSKTIPGFSLLMYTGLPKQLKPSLKTKTKAREQRKEIIGKMKEIQLLKLG